MAPDRPLSASSSSSSLDISSETYIEETVTVGRSETTYVVGILTSPAEISTTRAGRVVVICHGLGGHKDYCYQKLLARTLASELGLYSFRFDFRQCGDSSDIVGPDPGVRSIQTDMEDLDAVVLDYLVGEKRFLLAGIVGHSRGAVAVFKWALRMQKSHPHVPIPTIINCSGRHRAKGLMEKVLQDLPNVTESKGYYLKAYRNGYYPDVWIPLKETQLVSSVDISDLPTLDPTIPVLSVYGLEDTVVPLEDAARFANDLKSRHHLEFIPLADHNFYGERSDHGKANYNPLVVEMVSKWFSPDSEQTRFMETHKYAGVVSRWTDVQGVNNFRDFGGYKTHNNTTVRPGLLFRAANLSYVTPAGMQTLRQLGVKTVFDLRSESERNRVGAASIPGIDTRWTPIFQKQDASPAAIARRYQHFFDPVQGFQRAYHEILTKAGVAYREIMLHLRDRPDDGILIHCTAGKDRTGVICALILMLMEVDNTTVAREYEMTTYGLRDEIPRILASIERDDEGMQNPEGMMHMLSSKFESMIGAIAMINRELGGVVHYLKEYCQLTDDDLETIKRNLAAQNGYGWKWHSTL
jgi:protein tyrosine/serine phosphatase/alpha-beta hydrolase superfamily lysophospholipase